MTAILIWPQNQNMTKLEYLNSTWTLGIVALKYKSYYADILTMFKSNNYEEFGR